MKGVRSVIWSNQADLPYAPQNRAGSHRVMCRQPGMQKIHFSSGNPRQKRNSDKFTKKYPQNFVLHTQATVEKGRTT